MHLLTWVGFGFIGYVPNTLYTSNLIVCSAHSKYILNGVDDMKKFDYSVNVIANSMIGTI
jgi:hypothetical protein